MALAGIVKIKLFSETDAIYIEEDNDLKSILFVSLFFIF